LGAEPDNPATHFFLGLCYMFLEDPRADAEMKRALGLDPKKTRQLFLNFYTFFIKDDPKVGAAMKKRMEERIRALG
ncbi:MAG: hypothetical protein V1827_04410, partial [Candidatus Micrarchaeota archaeon]